MNSSKGALTKRSATKKAYSEALDALLSDRSKDPEVVISFRSVAKRAGKNHVSLSDDPFYSSIRERIEKVRHAEILTNLTPSQKLAEVRASKSALKKDFHTLATRYQDAILLLRERIEYSEQLERELKRLGVTIFPKRRDLGNHPSAFA